MFYAYPNFLNKGIDPFRMQGQNYFDYPLVFVDTCEDLVMADDVATPSNLPVVPIEKEELEEASLDMNVFQQSREE
jgi:hypothetical protein